MASNLDAVNQCTLDKCDCRPDRSGRKCKHVKIN